MDVEYGMKVGEENDTIGVHLPTSDDRRYLYIKI